MREKVVCDGCLLAVGTHDCAFDGTVPYMDPANEGGDVTIRANGLSRSIRQYLRDSGCSAASRLYVSYK